MLSNRAGYEIYIGDQFDTHTLKQAMAKVTAPNAFVARESEGGSGSAAGLAVVSKGQAPGAVHPVDCASVTFYRLQKANGASHA